MLTKEQMEVLQKVADLIDKQVDGFERIDNQENGAVSAEVLFMYLRTLALRIRAGAVVERDFS